MVITKRDLLISKFFICALFLFQVSNNNHLSLLHLVKDINKEGLNVENVSYIKRQSSKVIMCMVENKRQLEVCT